MVFITHINSAKFRFTLLSLLSQTTAGYMSVCSQHCRHFTSPAAEVHCGAFASAL